MAARLRGCGAAWGARCELGAFQQEGSKHMMCETWETSAELFHSFHAYLRRGGVCGNADDSTAEMLGAARTLQVALVCLSQLSG